MQRLRGFEKVLLGPGEQRTVTFTLGTDDLALLDSHLQWVVEPGDFEVAVGSSSREIHADGRFEVLAGSSAHLTAPSEAATARPRARSARLSGP